ncbi:MAG: hypothetical protein HY812_16330 [Planctomycetes bacterium]|nr:hypothetical protein [Planctomycetota bacterium]
MRTSRTLLCWLAPLLASCAAETVQPPPAASDSLVAWGLGGVDLGAEASRVVLCGPLAFVGCGEAGVRVVDVSEPRQPEVIAAVDDLAADAIAVAGDVLFVATLPSPWQPWTSGRVTSVGVIDPREPGPRTAVERDLGEHVDIAAEGGWIAVAAGEEGLSLIEARSLAAADLAPKWDAERADAVLVRRGLVFALGRRGEGGLLSAGGEKRDILVAVNAERAELVCRLDLAPAAAEDDGARDLALARDLLLIAGADQVRACRIGAEEILVLEALAVPGAAAIACDGDVGAVATGDVVLLDLAGAEAPRVARRIQTPGLARDVALKGRLLAVADGAAGLRLYEVRRRSSSDGGEPAP